MHALLGLLLTVTAWLLLVVLLVLLHWLLGRLLRWRLRLRTLTRAAARAATVLRSKVFGRGLRETCGQG